MEIILNETISSLGSAGDIVTVADGYARNYLLPKGKAILAEKKNVALMERRRAAILARAAKQREEFQALANQLESMDITIPVRVGEDDKLYGSVTSMDIAKVVEDKGYSIDRKKIQLPEAIKAVGEYEVPVRVAPEVTATLKVKVVPEEISEED
jgi:large subunit ribosomal protein L9